MTAKEYLMTFKQIKREIEDIDKRMAQLRLKYIAPGAIDYDDMPKAHNTERDLSDYMAKMDELTNYLIRKYAKLRGVEVDIYMRVDKMDVQKERMHDRAECLLHTRTGLKAFPDGWNIKILHGISCWVNVKITVANSARIPLHLPF